MKREHGEDDCWCNPSKMQICPQDNGDGKHHCWRCDDQGLVEIYDNEQPIIFIHHMEREL